MKSSTIVFLHFVLDIGKVVENTVLLEFIGELLHSDTEISFNDLFIDLRALDKIFFTICDVKIE